MVSDITLNPQRIRSVGSGPVPTLRLEDTQTPNIAGIPTVSPTGFNTAGQAFSDLANQASRARRVITKAAVDNAELQREREREEQAAVFADIKSRAIRRASEIRAGSPLDLTAYDERWGAYSQEILQNTPEALRGAVSTELFSIGTTKRDQIIGRVEQDRIANIQVAQQEAIETDLRDILSAVEDESDYFAAGQRLERHQQQILQSTLSAEQKTNKVSESREAVRSQILAKRGKELFEQGRQDLILPELANLLEGPLGSELSDIEKLETAKQEFKRIEFYERDRIASENRFEKQRDKLRDANYEFVVNGLAEGEVPTVDQVSQLDLSGPQKLALFSIAQGQDTIIDDTQTLKEIRDRRLVDPQAARDLLSDAVANQVISTKTFLAEEQRIQDELASEGISSPLARSFQVIDNLANERTLQDIPAISVNVENAKEELQFRLDEFRQGNPDSNSAQVNSYLRQETLNVIKDTFPANIFSEKLSLPVPYKANQINRSSLNTDAVNQAGLNIIKDFDTGVISESRKNRELENIDRWLTLLETEEQIRATINQQ